MKTNISLVSREKVSEFLHIIFFLLIATSVLTYLPAAQYAVNGNWHPGYFKLESYISLVPSWQKAAKDISALILLAFSWYFPATDNQYCAYKQPWLDKIYSILLMFLGIVVARSILSKYSIIQIVMLVRPILFSFSIFVFCRKHLSLQMLTKTFNLVNCLGLIQFYYCFLQRQNAIAYNGINWLSRGDIRAVGTFINPNTMGFFLALNIYLNFYIKPNKFKFLISLIYTIALFWADSLTGLLAISLFVFEIFCRIVFNQLKSKQRKNDIFIQIFFGSLLGFVALFLADFIKNSSNRGSGYSLSGGRVEIFLNYLKITDSSSLIIGRYWGFGSNLLQTIQSDTLLKQPNNHSYFIADSTFTALIAQFGLVGFGLIISAFYCLWKYPKHSNYDKFKHFSNFQPNLSFLIYLFMAGFATNLFENYAILPIIISLFFVKNKINVYSVIQEKKKYAIE